MCGMHGRDYRSSLVTVPHGRAQASNYISCIDTWSMWEWIPPLNLPLPITVTHETDSVRAVTSIIGSEGLNMSRPCLRAMTVSPACHFSADSGCSITREGLIQQQHQHSGHVLTMLPRGQKKGTTVHAKGCMKKCGDSIITHNINIIHYLLCRVTKWPVPRPLVNCIGACCQFKEGISIPSIFSQNRSTVSGGW